MTPLETLDRTLRLEHHAAAHALAERLYPVVLGLVDDGVAVSRVVEALETYHERFRVEGNAVYRDAIGEIIDSFIGRFADTA